MASVWAVVVAAGEGRRFGRQKQFELLAGRMVLEWSVSAARARVDGVVLVVPADRVGDSDLGLLADEVVAGGSTRSESVRAGISLVPGDADVIVVHDAARPFASAGLFDSVVAAVLGGAAGAVPGLGVTDTVKRVLDGSVIETLERSELVTVQTPQAFDASALRATHAGEPEGTDDASLLERLGCKVVVIDGEVSNRKLTDTADLELFERIAKEGLASS